MTRPEPPPAQLAEVSAVIAWAARLSAAGPRAGTAETAAYLTAKASLLERIAAGRTPGAWSPAEINDARQAAASARRAADAAAQLAAAGITTMED